MPRVKLFDENEVLNKAMTLFWKQGYAATSVQDLVNTLGINRASIYDTFGDKEQLFLKAIVHYKKTNTEGVSKFLNSYPNVKEGFQALFERAIDDSISDEDRKGCFVVNTTTEMIPGDQKMLELVDDNKKNFERIFHTYLQSGENSGQFAKDMNLEAMASMLFTLYNGLKVVSKVNPSKKDLTNAVRVALSVLD